MKKVKQWITVGFLLSRTAVLVRHACVYHQEFWGKTYAIECWQAVSKKASKGCLLRLAGWRILTVCVLSLPLAAKPYYFGSRNNRLGHADSFGYARMVRELGRLELKDGREFPLYLVFSSDPEINSKTFGPYWRMPLFASRIVQFGQYKLYWDGPDEYRHFFNEDHGADIRGDQRRYIERGKEWRATLKGDGEEVLIEAIGLPDWFYRYREGRLYEFRMGTGSEAYRVTWSGRDQILDLIEIQTGKKVFEIKYHNSSEPKLMEIGDTIISIEVGAASLTAPDGTTDYRNYRFNFLKSLCYEGGSCEVFKYQKLLDRAHSIANSAGLSKQYPGGGARVKSFAINRMEFCKDETETEKYLEWEAQTGFIVADSDSRYIVENPSWDPSSEEVSKEPAPKSVALRRTMDDGRESLWAYNWETGENRYTDSSTGEVYRQIAIMSEGAALGKIRKLEKWKGGEDWELLERSSYDPDGRLIRKITPEVVSTWVYERKENLTHMDHYINNRFYSKSIMDGQQLLERKVLKEDGRLEFYKYDVDSGLEYYSRFMDGIKLEEAVYERGKLLKFKTL